MITEHAPTAAAEPAGPAADGLRQESRTVHETLTVSPDDPFLTGHYPGFPLVPGFSLVQYVYDAVARAAVPRQSTVVLRRARFLSPVRPGEELAIEARIEHGEDGLTAVAKVTAGRRPAAEISLHYPKERA